MRAGAVAGLRLKCTLVHWGRQAPASPCCLPYLLLPPAVVGPSSAAPGSRPFAWSCSGELARRVSHVGQPDEFAYTFERMAPDPSRWRQAAPGA